MSIPLNAVPLACLSSSVLIAFTALWNLARRLDVCVSACVRSCLRLQGETKALCHCQASVERDAKLTEGTVPRLSVSSDPFLLRALLFCRVYQSHRSASGGFQQQKSQTQMAERTLSRKVANDQSTCQ